MSRPRRPAASTRRTPRARRAALAAGLMTALLTAAAPLALASPAQAAAQPYGLALRAEQAPRDPQGIELIATLTGPAPTPGSLAGNPVSFSVHLTQFSGAPLLTIGSAATNTAGQAVLTYHPTWTGPQAFLATATSTAGTTLASAATSFSAPSAAHPFAGTIQALRPDGAIGRAAAGVLLAIMAVLWITLITVLVRVNLSPPARPE